MQIMVVNRSAIGKSMNRRVAYRLAAASAAAGVGLRPMPAVPSCLSLSVGQLVRLCERVVAGHDPPINPPVVPGAPGCRVVASRGDSAVAFHSRMRANSADSANRSARSGRGGAFGTIGTIGTGREGGARLPEGFEVSAHDAPNSFGFTR